MLSLKASLVIGHHNSKNDFMNLVKTNFGSPDPLRGAIASARFGTCLNKSRCVIDRTPNKVQFFMKFY